MITATGYIFFMLLPLWVCTAAKILDIASIGPLIPAIWLLSSVILPVLFLTTVSASSVYRKLIAVLLGLCVAYLQFISYMILVPPFGFDSVGWL